ncbi:MAG: hypothetical protein R3246_15450 [Acidimicrobiia bacterium]|nr:hypothetical protein [Acidimicrobiia bacterium]
MDELIQKITDRFNIEPDKAKEIVGTVAEFLQDKLPGPIGDQVSKFLEGGGGAGGGAGDLMDKAKGALGGLLGGND